MNKNIYLIRPVDSPDRGTVITPGGYVQNNEIFRYNDGKWTPDDGTPDLAFMKGVFYYSVNVPDYSNLIWEWRDIELVKSFLPNNLKKFAQYRGFHSMTINNEPLIEDRNNWNSEHPNKIAERSASDRTCAKYHCANGISAYIDRDNEYIRQGMIWVKGNPDPIKPPDNPICYLCLDNGRGHLLEIAQWAKESYEEAIPELNSQIEKAENDIEDWKSEIETIQQNIVDINDLLKSQGVTNG